ncbi:MAG: hypothetical protein HC852_15150 [Acaryochloridaceae cyanobacterium RU_4_10]|nr:hypothetical protein [Acaryochloridaceae cyanobacterium RU_4_10]
MSTKKPKHHNNKGNASRTLVLAALMTTGMLQPLLPAFALGTAPGDISNTATATYTNDANQSFTSTSNTVKVTVAEVAALRVAPAGIKDLDGGAVQAGDTLSFDFKITNDGNSPTDIAIPSLANITTDRFNATTLEYALVNPDGSYGAFVAIPGGTIPNVLADQSYIVRVTGTVPTSGLSAGADIRVTLGDTLPNDNSLATQNQPDAGPSGDVQAKDVRTVNIGAETPIDGEREASATQFIDFATQIKPLALATLRKNVATVTANTSATTDDQITYALNLTVENTSPSGAFSPEKLAATDIKLGNATVQRVLVSDVVPAGTVFDPNIAPVAPDNTWTVVYSIDDPATTVPVVATGGKAAANWVTAQPAANLIKRIGYIHNGPLDASGVPINGFRFTVTTSNLPALGASVYNLAQVFGQTYDDPANPVNPTTEIVYDESGDNKSNNFNDDGTPPDSTGSNFDPVNNTGVPNPGQDGVDPGNNTGTGPNGELTRVNIGAVASASEDILNGPLNQPGATGPTDANDDFTNVSTPVPQGTQNAFDPAPVTIQQTVQNPSTNTVPLANVTIEPISPKQAEGADSNGTVGKFGLNAAIPNGTIVTITYGAQSATYVYNLIKGIFEIQGAGKPVNVGELVPGAKVDYTVVVNLPLDAALTKPLSRIPIPILAFSDDDPLASPGYNDTLNIQGAGVVGYVNKTPELNNNVTNDNVYLGYMQLVKEARILDANGTERQPWATTFSTKAQLGDVIEYRIKYKNISTPMQGSGNVVLNANGFKILEDGGAGVVGDIPSANNWAATTNHQPTTQFDRGTVEYFSGTGSINSLGTTDPAANAQVGTYLNDVGNVAPGALGEFLFRRQVNK